MVKLLIVACCLGLAVLLLVVFAWQPDEPPQLLSSDSEDNSISEPEVVPAPKKLDKNPVAEERESPDRQFSEFDELSGEELERQIRDARQQLLETARLHRTQIMNTTGVESDLLSRFKAMIEFLGQRYPKRHKSILDGLQGKELRITRSEMAFAKIPEVPDDIEFVSAEERQEQFNKIYLGAFDKYFSAEEWENKSEADALSWLINEVLGFYSMPEISKKSVQLLIESVTSDPSKRMMFPKHRFVEGERILYFPLDPDRQLNFWLTPEKLETLVSTWLATKPSPVRLQIIYELLVSASLTMGCDSVLPIVLHVIKELPATYRNWTKHNHISGANMAFASLPDLMAVLMAGTDDKDLLPVLLIVQDTMVWFMNRRLLDIKYREYEDLVFLGTYNVRRLAVARALHYARLPDDRSYELSTKTRFSYALDFNNKAETDLKYIGTGMLQIALLYPAVRLARAPVTDEESPEYLEFVAEYPERPNTVPLWRLGAVTLPHILDSTKGEHLNRYGPKYAADSLGSISGELGDTYKALLTSKDVADIRTSQVAFLKQYRSAEIKPSRFGSRWIYGFHRTGYSRDWRFSDIATYANTPLSINIAFEILALAEEQTSIVSQLDGHEENYKNESLSWQRSHNRPTILYTIQNTTLAREYLRYIVRFESNRYWRQKNGRHNMLVFAEVMERLTGIAFKNEEYRYNPKAWLKILKMKPDFSMLDVR